MTYRSIEADREVSAAAQALACPDVMAVDAANRPEVRPAIAYDRQIDRGSDVKSDSRRVWARK